MSSGPRPSDPHRRGRPRAHNAWPSARAARVRHVAKDVLVVDAALMRKGPRDRADTTTKERNLPAHPEADLRERKAARAPSPWSSRAALALVNIEERLDEETLLDGRLPRRTVRRRGEGITRLIDEPVSRVRGRRHQRGHRLGVGHRRNEPCQVPRMRRCRPREERRIRRREARRARGRPMRRGEPRRRTACRERCSRAETSAKSATTAMERARAKRAIQVERTCDENAGRCLERGGTTLRGPAHGKNLAVSPSAVSRSIFRIADAVTTQIAAHVARSIAARRPISLTLPEHSA